MPRIAVALLALSLLPHPSAPAQEPSVPASLATRRAQRLRHGINTGMWFAQAPGNYSPERLRTFTTAEDLALIRHLGFDHIRLSIDPVPLLGWQRQSTEGRAFMAELDHAVDLALSNHLAVILDVHPESSYKQQLLQGNDPVQHFAALWGALAQHWSTRDPEAVFLEIMNEPEQTDPLRWQGIQAAVLEQIRAVAPAFTVIASGAHWSGLPDLLALEPLADPDIIYTFHSYEPLAFTHQGATWSLPVLAPLRNVPYPSTPENITPNLAQQPTLAGQLYIADYGLARWDAARIDATLSFAERWAELHHVPVYCGEFGVHRTVAAPADRERWLRDMRVSLNQHNIGWAMWDFQTNFGAVTKNNGKTTPDSTVLRALGLTPSP